MSRPQFFYIYNTITFVSYTLVRSLSNFSPEVYVLRPSFSSVSILTLSPYSSCHDSASSTRGGVTTYYPFLPRDAIYIARTEPSQDVCLSVRYTPVFCQNSLTYLRTFSPSSSHTILGFLYQTVWQYSDGDPLKGALNARMYEKIVIFDQYLALSRKWYKIEP